MAIPDLLPSRPGVWLYVALAAVLDLSVLAGLALHPEVLDWLVAGRFPWISGVIFAALALGIVLSWVNLLRLLREERALAQAAATVVAAPDLAALTEGLPASAVRERVAGIARLGARGADGDPAGRIIIEDEEEARASWGRYITGVLTMLGLLGTFLGLMVAIESMRGLLSLKDFDAFFDGVVGALDGMGTAFSTSLAGIAGAVWLGLEQVVVHNAQLALLGRLEGFVSRAVVPRIAESAGTGGLEVELARLRGAIDAWRVDTAAAGADLRAAAETFAAPAATLGASSQAILSALSEQDSQWRRFEEELAALRRLAEGENRMLLDLAGHRLEGLGAEAPAPGAAPAASAGASDPASDGASIAELRRMNALLASIYREVGLALRTSAARLDGSQAEMTRLIQRLLQRSEHQATQGTHQILLLRNLLQYLGQDEARLKRVLDEVARTSQAEGGGGS